jgi:Uma2 family endonuclease
VLIRFLYEILKHTRRGDRGESPRLLPRTKIETRKERGDPAPPDSLSGEGNPSFREAARPSRRSLLGEFETESGQDYDGGVSASLKEVRMATVKIKEWTYEDYLALPEGGPLRYEIIDGALNMTPSPNIRHQEISINFSEIIRHFLRSNPIGKVFSAPYDVVFVQTPLQYVEPDLVFVSNARANIITEQNIQGVPDLIVEIFSPATEMNDRRLKLALYERFGVPEYWIADPETETVQVFRRERPEHYASPLEFRKEDRLDTPILPGLLISLSDVFHS